MVLGAQRLAASAPSAQARDLGDVTSSLGVTNCTTATGLNVTLKAGSTELPTLWKHSVG